MARTKSAAAKKRAAKKPEFRGFVNHNLTKQEKVDFDAWLDGKSVDELFTWLEEMVDNYYKMSVKHDSYGGGVQVSLTCSKDTNIDYGLVMTSRAPDTYNALWLSCFKHVILFNSVWDEYASDGSKVSQWG